MSDKHRQEEGASLSVQLADVTAYAAAHDLRLVAVYQDMQSGRKVDRTQYTRMLAEIERGDTVLAWKLDRGGRDAEEMLRFRRLIAERGAHLVFVTEQDTRDPFIFGIKAVLAEERSREIAAKVLPAMEHRVGVELRWVSRVPLGYRLPRDHELDYAGGRLVVDEAAAERVRSLWTVYLATGSLGTAATAAGVIPETASNMVRNPAYRGDTVWRGIHRPGTHPPLVPPATWHAALALIESRRTQAVKQRAAPTLLSGLLYLEDTDVRLHSNSNRARTQRPEWNHTYYSTKATPTTPRASIRRDRADALALDTLRGLALTPKTRAAYERDLARVARNDPHKAARDALARQGRELQAARFRASEGYTNGLIDAESARRLKAQHDRTEGEIAAALRALPPAPDLAAATPLLNLRTHLDRTVDALALNGDTTALRRLCEILFLRIEAWGVRSNGLRGRARTNWLRDNPPRLVCYLRG